MIVLELNLTESYKKLREHVDAYNQKMKAKHKDNYGEYTLKATHLRCAQVLLNAFGNHLRLQKSVRNYESAGEFKINNQAIATMMGQSSKRSSANQIKRLKDAGIILCKTFKGTNASYTIELNPDILVAKSNYDYTQKLIELYQVLTGEEKLDNKAITDIENITASFSVFFNGFGKFLPYIETRNLYKNLNHNIILKGIVENIISHHSNINDNAVNSAYLEWLKSDKVFNNRLFKLQETLQETIQETFYGKHRQLNQLGSKASQKQEDVAAADFLPAPAVEADEKKLELQKMIQSMAFSAYVWLISMLYDDKNYSEHDNNTALQFIEEFFMSKTNNSTKNLSEAFNEFIFRVQLTRKYIHAAPGRFVPKPIIWLDPKNEKGFSGTESWHKITKKKQEKIKNYYSHIKLVGELYKKYVQTPTFDMYASGRQRLSKIEDKQYLQLYDKSILKLKNHQNSKQNTTYIKINDIMSVKH
jgi:hypothetical protein